MISYEVEFPTQKIFSLKINSSPSVEGLGFKTIEAIGGDVKVQIDKKTLLAVPYREDVLTDFTLEGYNQRAKGHAQAVISKLVDAAQVQAAKSHEEIFSEKLDLIISLMPSLKV